MRATLMEMRATLMEMRATLMEMREPTCGRENVVRIRLMPL